MTPPPKTSPSPPKPKLDESRVIGCQYLHYPWDDWERWALACGLAADLGGLGRLLIREAFNHAWPEWLMAECGWRDDGQAMLALALHSPRQAWHRWRRLLDTDGLRGDYHPQTGRWSWGFLQPDAVRLFRSLMRQHLSTLPPSPSATARQATLHGVEAKRRQINLQLLTD